MKKHKHAEVIKAWADGAQIEFRLKDCDWKPTQEPIWDPDVEYRIVHLTKELFIPVILSSGGVLYTGPSWENPYAMREWYAAAFDSKDGAGAWTGTINLKLDADGRRLISLDFVEE